MRKLFLLSFVLFVSCYCAAAVLDVPSGSYPTIQSAITAAVSGVDTVEVGPGRYVETIDLLGKAITLKSVDPSDLAVVLATVIDANNLGTTITCDSGEGNGTVIDGFTITNGLSNDGGGMYNLVSSPTVSNCTFNGNTATLDGGGMYNQNSSSPTVTDSYFCFNVPDAIYGPYTDGGGNGFGDFYPPPRPIAPEVEGDVDGDGDVDMTDFALMAENWLAGTQ